ncbi:MAG: glycosyltransferase family 2 protein [Candidatus Omnitrophica bacterium]|nr:glycosyltransferase family 2 protein [Candidatus Omnitrophota bacterium]
MKTEEVAPEISVAVPVLNEETNVPALYEALVEVFGRLGTSWELIFVDDGSTDGTWSRITALNGRDKRVRGIRFSRNFGHQYAFFAGITKSSGRAVITMDGDLQHPPDRIPDLIREWKNGSKIVHTVRIDARETPFFRRMLSVVFYRLYAYLSGAPIEVGMADFRLIDRQVVDELKRFREAGIFLRGLVHWVGYPSAKITVQYADRHSGKPQYTYLKLSKLMWSGITSFSIVPLRIGVFVGLITSALAFAELVYALIAKLVFKTPWGWTSAVSLISFLFGILFVLIGLLGEYIGRVLIEVQDRPRYIVREEAGLAQP